MPAEKQITNIMIIEKKKKKKKKKKPKQWNDIYICMHI